MGSFPSPEQLRSTYHAVEEFLDTIRPTVDRALKLDDAASLRTLADSLGVEVAKLAKPSKELERLRAIADCVVSRKPPELMELEGDWVVDIIRARVEELISWIGRRSEFMALKKKHAQEPPVFKDFVYGDVIKRKVSAATNRFQYFDRMQKKENDATTPPQWTSVDFIKKLNYVLLREEKFLLVALLAEASNSKIVLTNDSTLIASPSAVEVDSKAAGGKGKKRFRVEALIEAMLLEYHKYEDGKCANEDKPIGVRDLAKLLGRKHPDGRPIDNSTQVSDFFIKHFGSHKQYIFACNKGMLADKLKGIADGKSENWPGRNSDEKARHASDDQRFKEYMQNKPKS